MSGISFIVEGDPKGQPRPRAFARKMGDKFVARVYDAATAEGWKSIVALGWRSSGAERFTGPIRLTLKFHIRRPKSHSGAKGLKPSAPIHHCQKPDGDNFAKAVMDALTQCNAWEDDCNIVDLRVTKDWAEYPGCEITIEPLEAA